jgi:hypothetical protein
VASYKIVQFELKQSACLGLPLPTFVHSMHAQFVPLIYYRSRQGGTFFLSFFLYHFIFHFKFNTRHRCLAVGLKEVFSFERKEVLQLFWTWMTQIHLKTLIY